MDASSVVSSRPLVDVRLEDLCTGTGAVDPSGAPGTRPDRGCTNTFASGLSAVPVRTNSVPAGTVQTDLSPVSDRSFSASTCRRPLSSSNRGGSGVPSARRTCGAGWNRYAGCDSTRLSRVSIGGGTRMMSRDSVPKSSARTTNATDSLRPVTSAEKSPFGSRERRTVPLVLPWSRPRAVGSAGSPR